MQTIDVARAHGIVTITLDAPTKKNAISALMWDELYATLREVQPSSTDRVVASISASFSFPPHHKEHRHHVLHHP